MPDRAILRQKLIRERLDLPQRLERAEQLQSVLRVWLLRRQEDTIGAYWPIKGEFDPLPALYRWSEANPRRRIGLPVVDKAQGMLRFHVWYPGCPMEEDATGIPKPKDTEQFQPQLLLLPCLGYGPEGLRLGYGGGFMGRTIAALQPRPATAGLGFAHGFLPLLRPDAADVALDAMLTEEGVVWEAMGAG
ncbi:5-formyltetrahydrofolate cyclo-ligase [Kinneretia asaccharophila]|uniref:5-formyltetrahydrofolate cyclo-ligase n=1 Tax=Roseateles asaccharophilus TaxID=582607 RepID=A0A4R6MWA3_9BURK|nr:5-formyltetrahydrofolate cyclo-ligase [Roseateles asaccharophilus]MDN3544276.1 5-formyltetrahydrofolate cyclo-ligase [Roseateles asaccharophilus]TDP06357.1 5,10-methenyltetrahydrofolate synthetase [Roseateles asaccharophilus]